MKPLRTNETSAFTLIELLVVLAIVAVLLTIAVPRYFSSVDRAKETVLVENLRTTRDAIDKFFSDTGRYPNALDELVQRSYLRTVPHDPVTDSADTWVLSPPRPHTRAVARPAQRRQRQRTGWPALWQPLTASVVSPTWAC